jgi:uncharacterized phage-like protein YoqJ
MIIAGTGHGPNKLGGYGADIAHRMVKIAGEYIEELDPDVIISGMAIGWDQAIVAAAMQQSREWWAYVPFVGQEKAWPDKAQKLYQRLLESAHLVKICSPGTYLPEKMQLRNETMVDAADKMLALWNGASGGTANCLRYAEAQGVPVVNAWDKWSLQ